MVIGICGIGATGSSAVEDLLREYDDVQSVADDEFNLIYTPDGLLDLEYHLVMQPNRFFSSDVAIKRFVEYTKKISKEPHGYYNRWTQYRFGAITNKYIESLVQMRWKGYWYFDAYECSDFVRTLKFRLFDNRFLTRIQVKLKKKIITFLDRDMYLSVEPECFYEKTKMYLYNIFEAMGVDVTKPVCVSQLFPGNNPMAGMQFFDDAKAIVIDRDPRDLYVLQKMGKCVLDHWSPTDTVEHFVEYYKYCRRFKYPDDSRVKNIQFEDLIYNYEDTVKEIEQFLGLDQHVNKKHFFVPEISINNTQLYVGVDDIQEDIRYVEKELREYLYDYSKFPKKESTINIAF